MSKLSIVIPVYFNEETLKPLYKDLKERVFSRVDEYEVVFVDDGSKDNSYNVIKEIAREDKNVKAIKLSRNFGSHSAILAGLVESTGDCAVIKAADMQEPSELLIDMFESWKSGNRIVLAERQSREDDYASTFFADLYYSIIRNIAMPNMPKHGFDIFLIDRDVINVLKQMNESNTSIVGQVLWCGFQTGTVEYTRKQRESGKSRWTITKKIKLVIDSVLGFSYLPIRLIAGMGIVYALLAVIYLIYVLIAKFSIGINVQGWSTLIVIMLFSFGLIMFTLGVIGEYLWRVLDAARGRPVYIIEEKMD